MTDHNKAAYISEEEYFRLGEQVAYWRSQPGITEDRPAWSLVRWCERTLGELALDLEARLAEGLRRGLQRIAQLRTQRSVAPCERGPVLPPSALADVAPPPAATKSRRRRRKEPAIAPTIALRACALIPAALPEEDREVSPIARKVPSSAKLSPQAAFPVRRAPVLATPSERPPLPADPAPRPVTVMMYMIEMEIQKVQGRSEAGADHRKHMAQGSVPP
ncbi:uncharacterized protein LOC125727010 [Brienomyrus brachyistius]|uniref:uncharacterized protein LOC125727010 n=1 Tax=Brienomyrus brachyistius TaxID=42636 RepID=UPI0020B26547|nr:uncharacterized protein LOC125727010 [Brienomyrus brachyistius]